MNNITIDTIRTYVKELEQKGYSNELIVRKLHATLDFLRWAYHKDFMKYSQFQQLKDEIANFKVKFEASDFHKAENTTPYASIDEDQEKSSVLRSIRSRIPFLNPHHKDSEKKTEGTSSELQNSSLSPRYYIGMAFVVLIIGILGSGIYERFFSTTSKIFAYPSSPSAAARILSFQGRLTDSLGNPITAATNMRFRLYTASSGGSTLYDSGTCSITPDQDGVHNVLIGSECGSEVASSVFTENTQVWLGVTVGSDSEMTPRQRIANVPYAINAETLQGLPVGTEVSNIPYINAGGDLLMAASSPQIGSTYTNQDFLISSARAITIQSAGSGDVTLTATESGTIKFATGGSQHGIITNGGLFGFGTTGPDAKLDVLYTGGEQLRLTYADGSTYTGFTTNSSGDLTIDPSGGDVFLANNDILNIGGSGTDTAYNAIADSVAGASANVNSDNDLYIEGNLEVDGTIYGNVSGTISPGFTQGSIVFADGSGNLAQDNASLYFDDTNNKVGIGTAAPVGKFHVTGAATGKALSIFNETGDQNIITASASGTTVANLDRSGNLAIEGAISDLGGTTLAVNDNLDVSGTLFSGTADAFQVDASGNITTTGDLAVNGDDITGDSNLTINAAGYVRVGDTASPGSANGDDDLFVEGDLEVDGTGYFDGIITQAGGDGSSYAGAVTFNDDVDFTLLGTENVSITNTISGNQSVDLLSVTLTDQTSSAVQRGVVVTKADTTDATTDSLLTIDNAETTANLLTDYLIITKASTGPDTTTDAIDVSDADLGNAINVGANTVVGTTADLDFSNFDVTGSTGNITTAGDIAINGGDITSTSTAFKFDIGNTGTLTFRDGTNNLVAIKDQGVYAFLNLSAKTDTGDPASCAEGDIYYNDADDTIKICHESNTWEALDGGAVASQWTDSGTTVYLTDTTDEVVIGGSTPLSSAKLSIDGDADQIQLIVQGNATQTTNLATFEQSDGTDVFTITNAGNLTAAGDLAVNGDDITGDSNLTINATGYVRVGDTASPGSANGDDDLFVEGDLEVDGVLYTDGGIDTTFTAGSVVFAGTSGVLAQDNANFFWDDTNNKLGLGTTAPDAKFQVTGAAVGKALTILNETGDQDIIAASASGTTRFRVGNDGTVYGGYFADISNTAYGIDPAGTSNFGGYSLKITGGALLAADSGNVGIGDLTPDAKLNIQATTEQLRLDYDDSNYTSFTVSSGGDLTLAPTGGDTNITGDVDVSDQLAAGPNGAITTNEIVSIDYNTVPVDTTGTIGIDLNQTLTGSGTSSAVHYGIANTLNESSSSTGNVNHTNFYNYMSNNNASIGGNSTWRGAYTYLQNNAASGTIGLTDQYMATTQNASTGNITDARNYYSSMINSSTGTLSNIYNFWAASPTNASGTITTAYGLYVADQSVGTNTTAYGLYVANQSGSSGNAIGLYIADADDYSIQLASTDGDAAGGITFGTDTNLYRSAANTLKTDDDFFAVGNITTSGDLAVNGNDITSSSNLTLNATGYTRIGDTASPGSATGDDDLFVESDIELDGVLYLDGTIDTTFTAGSVVFAGTSGVLAQDNASFFFDDTNNRLGIGDTTPDAFVDITGTTAQLRLSYETGDTNYTTFTTSSGGDLTIAPSGSDTNITGNLAVTGNTSLGDAATDVLTVTGKEIINFDTSASDQNGLYINAGQNTATAGTLRGLNLAANFWATSGTQTGVNGLDFTVQSSGNGGTVTTMKGISAWGIVGTGSTVGTFKLVDAANPTNSGTITSMGGFTIDNLTAGTNNTLFLAGTSTLPSGNWGIYNTSSYSNYLSGTTGIGTTGADAKLDVLSTTEQLRLTYTDGSVYSSFTTNSSGDLTIAPSGGDTNITGNAALTGDLAVNGDDITGDSNLTINAASYVRVGDTASPGSANGDDDLFVEGDLEVDGVLYADNGITATGTVSATDFSCTDCLDFAEFEDTLDLDAALTLNQTTNTWTQNFTGTTADGLTYNGNSLTSGNLIKLSTTSTSFTSGAFISADWSPGSTTTNSGDLLKINTGTNGNLTGNYINLLKGSSTLFKVAGGNGNVTTEGDLAINGGDITSSAALNIDVNTNITTPDTLTVGSATAGVGKLNVTGAQTGKALTILNETGDQNVLVASVSGTQVFALTNNGDVVQGKNGGISGLADNQSLAPNPSFEIDADGVYPPDGWTDSVGTNTTTSTSNHGNTAILFDTDTDAIISHCFPIAGGKNLAQGLGTDRTYTVSLWSQLVNAVANNGLNAGIYTYTSRSNCTSNSTPTKRAAFTNSSPTIVWGYTSGTVTPATGDTWARAYVIYDYSNNDADMRVDGVMVAQTNNTSGLDLAETYPADPAENVQMGEIVSFGTEAQQNEADINNIKRSSGQYDKNAFGIVATQPGYVLDDNKSYNKVKVALKGRVPVLVTTENGPIKIGDPITASSKPGVGMKATRSGRIIGYAMTEWTSSDPNEVDQVTVFVNPETYVDLSILTSLQESVAKLPALTASALSRADDIVINSADALLIKTERLVAQSITVVNATIDNLIVDRIVSREITAKKVDTDLLTAQKITTDSIATQDLAAKDATFSGKLVAQEIDADNIRELRDRLEKLSAENDAEPVIDSEQLQSEVENIQQYLENLPSQDSSQNLPINEISTDTSIDPGTTTSMSGDQISMMNVDKLTVTGESAMTSLVVADSFTAGNIFIKDNSVLSLSNELKLSALEQISLMDGAVIIAKNGTITAKGEVIAEKGVRTNTIKPIDANSSIGVQLSQNKVEVLNNDAVVAAIDNNGSAKFKDVSVDTYTDATGSAAIIAAADNLEQNGIFSPAIQTNAAAAGNGILPAKNDTVVIYNDKIGPNTLVYITATSKTYNNNLYVEDKKSCTAQERLEENCKPYFTVHIDAVVKDPITFNWWTVN